MTTQLINISVGELWDKYTILLIKQEKIKNTEKLKFISNEINFLDKNMKHYNYLNNDLFLNLKNVNLQLWDIEDNIRIKEFNKKFDTEFIDLARSVYITNDKRSELKTKINNLFGSEIQEVKDYIKYI
tara:strand:+ start:432 stop:815 length:384 start_codon:yes stop_codon:yes gene_type:complete